jgi:hypothetical protein
MDRPQPFVPAPVSVPTSLHQEGVRSALHRGKPQIGSRQSPHLRVRDSLQDPGSYWVHKRSMPGSSLPSSSSKNAPPPVEMW